MKTNNYCSLKQTSPFSIKRTIFLYIKGVFLPLLLITTLLLSCRKEEPIIPSTDKEVTEGQEGGEIKGFFLLNEGNMGSNKATLDYFDYESGVYTRNIYGERNPGVVKELGDVGNDLQIYGDKLYAVINCSHFVEVMDLKTAKHITQISIPNCRYITFKDQYAYISSYAGPVLIDPNARLGYVARVDTAQLKSPTLQIDTCVVGYQPEEMVVVGNKLYVANSGGYRVPNYDRTISVIDLTSFKVIKTIDVAINLHRMKLDSDGKLYVSSRGDYYGVRSKTFVIDTEKDEVIKEIALLPNSNMVISEKLLYLYSTEWSYITNSWNVSYALYNTKEERIITRNLIKDGTDKTIVTPYGIAVNREREEFFVTDAKDYVTPGTLHCYGADGKRKWSVTTGDIPAHIAFTTKKLEPIRN